MLGGLCWLNLADSFPEKSCMTFSRQETDESHTQSQTGCRKVSAFLPHGWGHQLETVKSKFDRTTPSCLAQGWIPRAEMSGVKSPFWKQS